MTLHKVRQPTAAGDREFLEGGGEMGALTRAYDWTATPLGPPEQWPHSLRIAVRLLLTSRHPMFIWWGRDLIQFYNDAYRQTMGPERHPSALGQPGRACWQEIWDIIGPQIAFVMAGKGATWHEDQLVPVTRHGSRQDVWWTYGYSPIDDGTGGVGGVLVVCNDVTEQHLATERLRQLFDQAPGFIAIMRGPDHVFEMVNPAYSRLVAGREVIGQPLREALPEVVSQGFTHLLDTVLATGEAFVAKARPVSLVSVGGGLEERYLDFVYQPIFGSDGRATGIFLQGHDVTEQVLAAKQREFLTGELEHRVKNTLAMVSALASQTFRSTDSHATARDVLARRIAALGVAHDALNQTSWRQALLQPVVKGVLAAHDPSGERIKVSGPNLVLTAQQALSLSLALNELATNAAKYGALSVATGSVEVSWRVADGAARRLCFAWRESGGPAVVVPTHRGFGTRLIQDALAADFSGEVRIDYEPAGLVCTLDAPLEGMPPQGAVA